MMPEWWRITDTEWREFQSIPEQGYSHRYWIESRLIATRLNAAIDRIKGTQPSEQEFLSHYAANVTVPQPSEPEPCDHGSYWTDHDGRDHCLVCPHVSQPSDPSDEWCDHYESPGSCPVFGCLNHEPSEPDHTNGSGT